VADPSAPALPAALAGRYTCLRVLGRGAFGTVVLAEDRGLGRPVALKLLDLARADAVTLARFEREARATAQLRHPGIVEVYDHGTDATGTAWIAYERIAGIDLRRRLEEGDPPARAEALRLGVEGARALAAAHRAGIVHRDLKPANAMVREDGRLVLCDFGLAQGAGLGASLTATGAVVGTPSYLAPEAWLDPRAGPAADQWAWAAVVFEMVYGRRRRVRPAARVVELAQEESRNRPPRIPPGLAGQAPALEAALLRALAIDPGDRFPDLDALADALAAAAREGEGPEASRTTIPAVPRPASGGFDPVRAAGASGAAPSYPRLGAQLVGSAAVLAAGIGLATWVAWLPPEAAVPAAAAPVELPDLARLRAESELLARPYRDASGRLGLPRPTVVDAPRAGKHFTELVDPRLPPRLERFFDALVDLSRELAAHPDPRACLADTAWRGPFLEAVLVLPAHLANLVHALDVAATESPLSLSVYERGDPGVDRNLLRTEWPGRSRELSEILRRGAARLAPEAGAPFPPFAALRLFLLSATETEGLGTALDEVHRLFLAEHEPDLARWLGLALESALATTTFDSLLPCPQRGRILEGLGVALVSGHPGLDRAGASLLAARTLVESLRQARLCAGAMDGEWDARTGILLDLVGASRATDPATVAEAARDGLRTLRGIEPLYLPCPPRLLALEPRLAALGPSP
jgi:hypothetical protein